MSEHNVLVYGTLRPGAQLFHKIHKQVTQVIGDLAHPGGMYYDYTYRVPVVDLDELDRQFVADLLTVTDEAFLWIDGVERAAGYHPRTINVRIPDLERTEAAVCYHWPHHERGIAIAAGDWFNADYSVSDLAP